MRGVSESVMCCVSEILTAQYVKSSTKCTLCAKEEHSMKQKKKFGKVCKICF